MGTLLADIRYGMRMIARSPGFAAIAILTLALGIGANTALFSVVSGVLLNPLPYQQPDRLVAVYSRSKDFPHSSISYPNFLDWVRYQRSFSSLAAFRQEDYNLTGMGEPERVEAEMVSASFFSVLGVNPAAGRLLHPQEDQAGAQPVALISGGFWKRKFGSSPRALGKMLILNGVGYTVVGVIPADFRYQSGNFHPSDVYVPIGQWNDTTFRDRHAGMGMDAVAAPQAGSDAPPGPGRHGRRGAAAGRGLSGRRQELGHRTVSAQGRRSRQDPALSPGAAGRGWICAPDCMRECG